MSFCPAGRVRVGALAVAIVVGSAVVAPAGAAVPNGNGLVVIASPISCEGGSGELTISLGIPTDHGATSWSLTTNDHMVAKSFAAVFTLTPIGGGEPIVFTESKTYGVKQGLTERTCPFSRDVSIPDVGSLHFDATLVVAVVPPEG
jgi:hypothetical protein